ncbi:MAG: ATP-binding protein, partial [Longicatena sp.]
FSVFNYGLVLLFGVFLSVLFVGENQGKKENISIIIFLIFTLCIQIACVFLFGLEVTKMIYPLIVHLPLIIFLVLVLKNHWGESIVSVLVSYFCCQLPRWTALLFQQIFHAKIIYNVTYSIAIIIFFLLIWRFFAKSIQQAMKYSKRALFLFGCLPAGYYIFDYTTSVYTHEFYSWNQIMDEFLPTVLVLFYVWFIVAYQDAIQQKMETELEKNMLSMQMETAKFQISALRSSQEQSSIYRHDMRHHLSMIDNYAQQGSIEKIIEYISNAHHALNVITPMRFCENETVNLLLSSFVNLAQNQDSIINIKADLPEKLNISDAELCSLLSNGLENALNATRKIEDTTLRKISFNCHINQNRLLIKIENTYEGDIQMLDNVPTSSEIGHGYGCKSMCSVAKKRNGFCDFNCKNGVFTVLVVLSLNND